jgi:hypothetical protein
MSADTDCPHPGIAVLATLNADFSGATAVAGIHGHLPSPALRRQGRLRDLRGVPPTPGRLAAGVRAMTAAP